MTAQHRIRWCFHTTAMVADYERTRDALIHLVGLRVLEDSRLEDPAIGRRGGMAWLGDNIIEIGEPIVEGGAVDRFVRRFGSHMSSIAVQVNDINASIEALAGHGVRVSAQIDGHIVFTNPADTCGIVIEWFGAQEALDPRFGGPIPPPENDPVLDVRRMAFGGAVVDDPVAAAERIAMLFGRDVTFVDRDARVGAPVAGVSMGDMTLALFLIPTPAEGERLWRWSYTRAQTCNLGVLVPDLADALGSLRDAGFAVLRHDERSIVIGPAETGGVTLVVVDELLPGDPRC